MQLEWAVKPSFVAYVEALPDGTIELSDGATRATDGAFLFRGDHVADHLQFQGAVHFRGHHGVLDLLIRDPRIADSAGTVELTVCVGAERIRFATGPGPLRDDGRGLAISSLATTGDGAAALGGVYSAGAALEPFRVCRAAA